MLTFCPVCGVGALQLVHGVAVTVCHPDIGSVKGDANGAGSRSEGAQVGAVAGPQLAYCVAVPVYDPDIGPVKGDATRGVDWEVAEVGAVAGPQLSHAFAATVCHPDAGSVKGDAKRPASNGESAEVSAVGGT